MKLISMTDFVLKQGLKSEDTTFEEDLTIIENYANFLKQPLKLEMFVPCDEDGNVLEEDLFKNNQNFSSLNYPERLSLEKAKEKVLFEGFEIYKHKKDCIIKDNKIIFEWLVNRFSHTGTTIESLTLSHDNFNLTPNAIKQIEL